MLTLRPNCSKVTATVLGSSSYLGGAHEMWLEHRLEEAGASWDEVWPRCHPRGRHVPSGVPCPVGDTSGPVALSQQRRTRHDSCTCEQFSMLLGVPKYLARAAAGQKKGLVFFGIMEVWGRSSSLRKLLHPL